MAITDALQRRHALERPGQGVEGLGRVVAHRKSGTPEISCQPRHLHPLQPVSVDKRKAGQGQHEQLRRVDSDDDDERHRFAGRCGHNGEGVITIRSADR